MVRNLNSPWQWDEWAFFEKSGPKCLYLVYSLTLCKKRFSLPWKKWTLIEERFLEDHLISVKKGIWNHSDFAEISKRFDINVKKFNLILKKVWFFWKTFNLDAKTFNFNLKKKWYFVEKRFYLAEKKKKINLLEKRSIWL